MKLATLVVPLLSFLLGGCQESADQFVRNAGQVNGTYSSKAAAENLNRIGKLIQLYHDRVGPVIGNNAYVNNSLLMSLTSVKPAEAEATLRRLLEDDDFLIAFLTGQLGQRHSSYAGDGTFLGQWGIPQTPELLGSYIRTQITDVSGSEPSKEAKDWYSDFYGTGAREYIRDPDLIDMLGFDGVPVTPGLGS